MKSFYFIALVSVLGLFVSCTNQPTSKQIDTTSQIIATDTNTNDQSNSQINKSINTDDAYEKIHVVFQGNPEKEQVQPMLEAVMNRYNMAITNDNVMKVGNALLVMKQESKIGVTEMEILKYVYQHPATGSDMGEAIGMAAANLELTK